MTGEQDLAARVGPDVAAVLARLGAPVADVVRVTGLPDKKTGRATFRVALEDGRVLKVRRLTRASRGTRFSELLAALASPRFPPVLALEGRVSVEPWLVGTPLTELPLGAGRLQQAADVLGALHATASLGGRRLLGTRPTRSLLQGTARRLAQLGSGGALARPEVVALVEAAVRSAPARATAGVAHTDFCADNLIEDAGGQLRVVDNEGLRLDFLDYDLARTWYRWPMSQRHWSVFLDRYLRWRRPPPDPRADPFWRIAAVVRSLHLRKSRGTGQEAAPSARLREILAALEGSAP